jgi:hypothetical protein
MELADARRRIKESGHEGGVNDRDLFSGAPGRNRRVDLPARWHEAAAHDAGNAPSGTRPDHFRVRDVRDLLSLRGDVGEAVMPEKTAEDVAKEAYNGYGKVTDFKNYQGLPMPKFKDLPSQIQAAWVQAVKVVWHEFWQEQKAFPEQCITLGGKVYEVREAPRQL